MKVLVVYLYHDSNEARINLDFFQNYGMYSTESADFILCVNGYNLSILLNNRWNKVLSRENRGYDFGGWSHVLATLDTTRYNYFIFLNTTVRGPFGAPHWIGNFCRLLDDRVKLAGITISCHTSPFKDYFGENRLSVPHVQSMLWCTDHIGLEIIRPLLDPHSNRDKHRVIIDQEIGISQKIISAGYNIRCILPGYDADYTKGDLLINTSKSFGDPWCEGGYFGPSLHPYETIFFKTNRNVGIDNVRECTRIQQLGTWYNT